MIMERTDVQMDKVVSWCDSWARKIPVLKLIDSCLQWSRILLSPTWVFVKFAHFLKGQKFSVDIRSEKSFNTVLIVQSYLPWFQYFWGIEGLDERREFRTRWVSPAAWPSLLAEISKNVYAAWFTKLEQMITRYGIREVVIRRNRGTRTLVIYLQRIK
jgi:hypothetical protein